MITKQDQIKVGKIFCLTSLLIEEIDDPVRTPTKETKAIQDKARELQQMLEPVLERFYDNQNVTKSTFFTDLQNRINFIFNKCYSKLKIN